MSRRWAIAFGVVLAAGLLLLLTRWIARMPSPRSAAGSGASSDALSDGRSASTGPRSAERRTIVLFPDAGARSGSPAAGHLIARAAWGSGPDQVGHRLDPEAAPEGPMSLTVDGAGNLLVLDQINRRVQRFTRDGKRLAPIPIGGDAAQDLAATKGGNLLVLDRLGERNVQLFGEGGKPLGEVDLRGPKLPEPGGVTGLYTDSDGNAYAEREHGELVRVADADGRPSAERPTLPGRPRKGGGLYLRGALADRAAGTFTVRALDTAGQSVWESTIGFGAPILYIVLLDSDASGAVYVGARVARESARPPYAIEDERLELRSLTPDGAPRGALTLAADPAPEEIFRELTVGDDGTVYRMRRTSDGVVLEWYRF